MKKITLFITAFFALLHAYAQDDLDLGAMLQKNQDSSQIFKSDDYYTWCSSVIKGEDGKYHMFYSRWPHGKRALDDDSMNYIFDGFSGWLKYSEIAYATADKLEGPYHYVKTILKGTGDKNVWDRYTMHNPQVRKFGKYYYLYYISNSFDSAFTLPGKPRDKKWMHWLQYNCTQKVGVLKAASLKDLVNGKFEKPVGPIMQADNEHSFEVTTNPTVTQGPDGKFYMMYKSRKPNVGNMTMWMAVCDTPDGIFRTISEVFTKPEMACEDPCLWYDHKRKRFYAAVKYYSNAKVLAPDFGDLALITSEDGKTWTPATHSLISPKVLQLKGQQQVNLAHLERPFVFTDDNGQPKALFAAASVEEPSKGDMVKPAPAFNTFNVSFLIK